LPPGARTIPHSNRRRCGAVCRRRPAQQAASFNRWGTRQKRKTDMSRYLAFALALFTITLAACNTIAGAGQDLSKGGQAITDEADKAK
jgi:entericidin B